VHHRLHGREGLSIARFKQVHERPADDEIARLGQHKALLPADWKNRLGLISERLAVSV